MSRNAEAVSEAPQQLGVYAHQGTGFMSSLTGAQHHSNMGNYSPSLELLQGIQVPLGSGPGQGQAQQQSAGPTGGISFSPLGAGLRSSGPFSTGGPNIGSRGVDAKKTEPTTTTTATTTEERQLCTFFIRTGTCAYGDRCKFKHPLDRPPPQLNTRGYPIRADEPDCAHYLKKGWCAFGPTCKFNHPEMQPSILNSYGLSQPPTAYVSLPTTTFPSPAVYSVPPAVPTLYYLPPGMGPNQLAGSTASQLAFTQQSALTAAVPGQMYRQPAPAAPYGGLGGAINGGVGGAMGNQVSVLQEAFQGLTLGRAGGLGPRK
ncbi:hypothetical protein VOLCADRAFT_103744 [Volvox carteri f. nagariensis]|uniref:C3H1-type domain-containing protein n=1 Tax=Volvox carteri f. nagariensis TaxID=3068 RepID=D8TN94_VOLCA|nr:uncharacterized protein VOLCADRAFT_103744 [Volvox carteri f. nagariensis]EFJ50950.1 hypothetical protein VOLCADRAFT_103744 [Volvox carteri f. nagariensis]|eukprot:XP_002947962.1 hypothetical protein VOLCADRAFT_103744 [Volvox carteri f. nagariensis]